MRKNWLKPLLIALALAAPLAANAQDDGDQPTLQAVTDPSFVPFEMLDKETGKMVGFDMDILREIADRAGFNINLKTMDFRGIIPAVQTGTADIAIAGITITEKRDQVVDFSDPYYDSGLMLLVPVDSDIKTLEDLEGKRVGTKIGSTSYAYLKKHVGDIAEIVPYPGSSDMYLALMGGSVDAVFYDVPNVSYFAKTKGEGQFETVGPLYQGQQYGLAFPADSKWVDDVNKAIASMKEDGTYAEIYKKWFGELPPKSS